MCCYELKQLQRLLFFNFSASNTAWATFSVVGPRSLVQISSNGTSKNHKKIIANKMEDSKRQLCTSEQIRNYPDDLESDFDTSSSSDDTDFESKFFFSFRTISWELKADTSWFVSNLPIKVDVFCRSLVPSSFDFYSSCQFPFYCFRGRRDWKVNQKMKQFQVFLC